MNIFKSAILTAALAVAVNVSAMAGSTSQSIQAQAGIQVDPAVSAEMPISLMQKRSKTYVQLKDYPSEPLHGLNWENFFIVIERDAGKVTIVDGDTKKIVTHIDFKSPVQAIKSTKRHKLERPEEAVGRFWYAITRDGKVHKIDLWQKLEKMRVAETQIAYESRDIAVSGDGKYVFAGGYRPSHFVFVETSTMSPKKVVSTRGINVDGLYVEESGVVALHTVPNEPATFLVAMKELGQMWQVNYSNLSALRITQIDSTRFSDNGFLDPTGRYLQIAAHESKQMIVFDTQDGGSLVARIDVAEQPHPGSGANWIDSECGSVGATNHLDVAKVSVWGNDPAGYKDQAWKICYELKTDGAGASIHTHKKSDYYWVDQTKNPELKVQQSVQIVDKKTRKIVKTIRVPKEEGRVTVNFEFNKDGDEVWVTGWSLTEKKYSVGEIVIYDAKTLKEIKRIKGLNSPTDTFNVYNSINHKT